MFKQILHDGLSALAMLGASFEGLTTEFEAD